MSRFVCSVCGYVHEDSSAPENCPVCMAPSSGFSEIEEVSPTENEPIENKGEEFIETEGDKKDDLLDKESLEPNERIMPTSDNNMPNTNGDATVSGTEKLEADEEAILNKYQENPAAMLQIVKWYKETYHVGLKEAKDRVDFVLDKHGLGSATKSGSGCMITILIAITSTLSAFFLL
jgi:hypothetical protein